MPYNIEYNHRVCDIVLDMFDNVPMGIITNNQLYRSGLPLPIRMKSFLSLCRKACLIRFQMASK